MDDKQLVSLATYYKEIKGSYEPEMYGCGQIYRDFGFYPSKLPFFVTTQHGVSLWDTPQSHDLESGYPTMFVFSKRMQKIWRQASNVPCHVIKHPYLYYREKNRITKNKRAQGTLFFFSHTSKEIEMELDIKKLICDLKNLPAQFKPITVCFYYLDILKGYHHPFIKHGFNVVTAGHVDDPMFVDRFYQIMQNYRYSLSNHIGSYAFFSIDLGIPFSLYGREPEYINNNDLSLPFGRLSKVWELPIAYKEASKIFGKLRTVITDKQKLFVEKELGKYDSISRLHFSYLLYKSYIAYSFKKMVILIRSINRKILYKKLIALSHLLGTK